MPREQTYSCVGCEQMFGSKWALHEHAKNCPVKRNAELARIHEALAWKQERNEQSVNLCYRYAARGFLAHHNARDEEARRFRDWFGEEYRQSIDELTLLSRGVQEANKLLLATPSRIWVPLVRC